MDEGYGIGFVYLDLCKVFDMVPHGKLLQKMKCFGISDQLITWIGSFLSRRTMRVVVYGVGSGWYEVLSGVPQGQ
jgi:Reverse transcriptase (RNA-dependent DNA polymerase)